jgi:hypothetical protein
MDGEVMNWTSNDFKKYSSSKAYHDDYAAAYPTTSLKPLQRAGIYGNIRGKRNGSGASIMACPATIPEVHQGVKQEKQFCQYKKDGKAFIEWNKNVVAVTQMDCTHRLDEYDSPKNVGEKAILQKIEYLYAVLEERLNTGQVISLKHPYG